MGTNLPKKNISASCEPFFVIYILFNIYISLQTAYCGCLSAMLGILEVRGVFEDKKG